MGVGLVALAWLAPSAAKAEGATLAARYTAPASCPDGSAFVREVAARTTKVVVSIAPDEAETTVAIETDTEGYVGKLTIAGAAPREVHASTCEETTAALSFVLALAYDPDAIASPAAPPRKPPAVAEVAARAALSPPTSPRAESPLAAPAPPLERELVVGGLVEVGSLAGASVGARLFFGVAWSGRTLAPALRVSVGRTLPSSETGEGGRRALLTFTDVDLEACGLSFEGSTARLRVRVCGLGLVGAVESDGRTAVPRSDSNAWATVGLSAPLTLALGRAVAIEIRPVVGRTLVFDRFYAEPNFTVYEAPPLYAKVGAGMNFRFR